MESADTWTIVIAAIGVLVSGSLAAWSLRVSSDARDKARDANTLAEREFKRTTESHAIFWDWSWDTDSLTLTITNIGLDDAYDFRVAVFKKPDVKKRETFRAYQTADRIAAEGGSLSIPIPGIKEYSSTVIHDQHGVVARQIDVMVFLRWKTPAGNPDHQADQAYRIGWVEIAQV